MLLATKRGLLNMKAGDLVVVKEGHKSAGDAGVIVEITGGHANVYWRESDRVYWIEQNCLEVIHESG